MCREGQTKPLHPQQDPPFVGVCRTVPWRNEHQGLHYQQHEQKYSAIYKWKKNLNLQTSKRATSNWKQQISLQTGVIYSLNLDISPWMEINSHQIDHEYTVAQNNISASHITWMFSPRRAGRGGRDTWSILPSYLRHFDCQIKFYDQHEHITKLNHHDLTQFLDPARGYWLKLCAKVKCPTNSLCPFYI